MVAARWLVLRVIVSKFPNVNVYSRKAMTTTDLGSVMLATVASMAWGWRVEVVNENNFNEKRYIGKDGLPDHRLMQQESPADVVGLCCGLSCTIERVGELVSLYGAMGVSVIAGGWHAHYCPEETLGRGVKLVVHGDGEPVIGRVLANFQNGLPLHSEVPGVSYLGPDGNVCHNGQSGPFSAQIPDMDKGLVALRNEVQDLDSLPYPNFGLLRGARLKVYPIGRTRGCGYNCEFCSVKGGVHSASAQHLFDTVNWLVETRRAKKFFIVDDRLEEDLAGTIEFFCLIKHRYGDGLYFIVQVRLESAKNVEFVRAMADAGVRTVCVGYESPIDEDLKAMRKGITSANMLEWTRVLGRYFWIHAMFIFGYPPKDGKSPIGADEMKKRFKGFIRRATRAARRGLSIQVLKAVPVPGSDLQRRLKQEGVLFPLKLLSWSLCDGNWASFMPKNMTLEQFQQIPMQIMNWFYSPASFVRICLKTIAFPVDLVLRGWHRWKRGWWKDVVVWGGSLLMRRWHKENDPEALTRKLQEFWRNKNS